MKKRRWIWIAAFVLWLGFIWGNSLQPAAVSSQQSGAVLGGLSALLEMLHLPDVLTMHLVRKLAHMTEYAILAVLAMQICQWGSRSVWGRMWNSGCLCLAAALVDETIQLFVEGRSGQISDLWVDLGGAALGILAALLLSWIRQKMRSGKMDIQDYDT